MRIMTNSYIKGSEYQNKFKNRMEKDIINDEEYQRFKEEETNTKKMSTILKSLNVPFKKTTKIGNSGSQQIHGSQSGRQGILRYNASLTNITNKLGSNQLPNNDLNN
jgi:hypothetical protein